MGKEDRVLKDQEIARDPGDLVIGGKRMRAFQSVVGVSIAVLFLLLSPAHNYAQARSDEPSDVFSETTASKLLSQVAEGLRSHSAKKMLSAFDLSMMDGGPVFKEQITALFNQYESIRVHFKLVEVRENVAVVDAELDGTPPNGDSPPQHKKIQLRLTAAKTSAGWRFVDAQPRAFFS